MLQKGELLAVGVAAQGGDYLSAEDPAHDQNVVDPSLELIVGRRRNLVPVGDEAASLIFSYPEIGCQVDPRL